MNWLSDDAILRLQTATELPDLSASRYRIVERIASGGMGTVYLAEDSVLGRRVGLKILDVPDASGELAARLLREAKILARLEHPGIVPVHDAGTLADGRVFYAMKLVEGQRLGGSTIKGIIAGVLIGFFAKKVNSLPLGILFGLAVGLALAFAVAAMPDANGNHYYFPIMLPGGLVGLIVGYATQKYGGAAPARTQS
jgi:hypothetical protein